MEQIQTLAMVFWASLFIMLKTVVKTSCLCVLTAWFITCQHPVSISRPIHLLVSYCPPMYGH